MSEEQEREHFSHWIATAMPFDANVGMVEHSIKTDAAWLGWMARAASEAFREVLARDAHTNPSRHPKPPQLSSGAELEKLAPVLGLKTWVCAACMGEREAKSEAREQQQLRAGFYHHEEGAK